MKICAVQLRSIAGDIPANTTEHLKFVDHAKAQGVMANSVGPSDNFVSVGQSAVWNSRGELVAQLDSQSEGMVIVNLDDGTASTAMS